MSKFIELTLSSGKSIWIKPGAIVCVEELVKLPPSSLSTKIKLVGGAECSVTEEPETVVEMIDGH